MHNALAIQLPASKSISNRVLILQALCNYNFEIENLSTAHDTVLLKELLHQPTTTYNVEDAGTVLRFLTAYLAFFAKSYPVTICGTARLHERPIEDLVKALNNLGANIEYDKSNSTALLTINKSKSLNNSTSISAAKSSQFVTALLLIASNLPKGLHLQIEGLITSADYIELTLSILNYFGIQTQVHQPTISIPHQSIIPQKFIVENDWSSAVYFYAYVALNPKLVITFQHLQLNSLQADRKIVDFIQDFGVSTTITNDGICIQKNNSLSMTVITSFDCTNCPDLAVALIVLCAIAKPNSTIKGLDSLQYKESNRVQALQNELCKVGIQIMYENDSLSFTGQLIAPCTICFNSYNDHRIVMALNLLSQKGFKVEFDNTSCVQKSFPNYWQEVEKIMLHIN